VVGIFSLEMSKAADRIAYVSSEAESFAWFRIRQASERGLVAPGGAQTTGTAPIYIDDTGGITVQQMRGKARRFESRTGAGSIDCRLPYS